MAEELQKIYQNVKSAPITSFVFILEEKLVQRSIGKILNNILSAQTSINQSTDNQEKFIKSAICTFCLRHVCYTKTLLTFDQKLYVPMAQICIDHLINFSFRKNNFSAYSMEALPVIMNFIDPIKQGISSSKINTFAKKLTEDLESIINEEFLDILDFLVNIFPSFFQVHAPVIKEKFRKIVMSSSDYQHINRLLKSYVNLSVLRKDKIVNEDYIFASKFSKSNDWTCIWASHIDDLMNHFDALFSNTDTVKSPIFCTEDMHEWNKTHVINLNFILLANLLTFQNMDSYVEISLTNVLDILNYMSRVFSHISHTTKSLVLSTKCFLYFLTVLIEVMDTNYIFLKNFVWDICKQLLNIGTSRNLTDLTFFVLDFYEKFYSLINLYPLKNDECIFDISLKYYTKMNSLIRKCINSEKCPNFNQKLVHTSNVFLQHIDILVKLFKFNKKELAKYPPVSLRRLYTKINSFSITFISYLNILKLFPFFGDKMANLSLLSSLLLELLCGFITSEVVEDKNIFSNSIHLCHKLYEFCLNNISTYVFSVLQSINLPQIDFKHPTELTNTNDLDTRIEPIDANFLNKESNYLLDKTDATQNSPHNKLKHCPILGENRESSPSTTDTAPESLNEELSPPIKSTTKRNIFTLNYPSNSIGPPDKLQRININELDDEDPVVIEALSLFNPGTNTNDEITHPT